MMETDQPAAAPPQPSTQLPPPPPAAADAAQASAPTSEQPPSARMPAPLPPPAQPAKPTSRRKGGRGRGGGPTVNQTADMVRLGAEIPIGSERLRSGWRPVRLSADDKAADVEVDDAQLAASSRAGYRMVRATHGACSGTWYFEVRIDVLGPSGAARVGWSTRQGELNAPVGADDKGFSYRSLQGSKGHKGWREDYGEPYGEHDVIGCLLHLPEGGRPFEQTAADVVKYKGKLYFPEGEPQTPQPLAGAFVAFAKNGVLQGKAYTDVLEGTYYPSLSLYTDPRRQAEAAAATVNCGEHGFAFPPPAVEGCPPPRPACELSGPPPGTAVAAQPAGQQQQVQLMQQQQQQQEQQQHQQVHQAQAEQPVQQAVQQATEQAQQVQQQQAGPSAMDAIGAPLVEQQQQQAQAQAVAEQPPQQAQQQGTEPLTTQQGGSGDGLGASAGWAEAMQMD